MKKLVLVLCAFALTASLAFADKKADELLSMVQNGQNLTEGEYEYLGKYYPNFKSYIVEDNHDSGGSLDLQGGPDGYGYRYVDNQSPDSVVYNWIELCGDATALGGPVGDDAQLVANIGFSFPYYALSYTQVSINTNGTLTFGTTFSGYSNTCINAGTQLERINVYWDDMIAAAPTPGTCTARAIYYKNFGNYTVFEWHTLDPFSGSGITSVEAILWDNGLIKIQFHATEYTHTSASATVGLESLTGAGNANGLQYVCNSAAAPNGITAGRAIVFFVPPPTTPELAASNIAPCGLQNTGSQSVSFRVTNNGVVNSIPTTAQWSLNGITQESGFAVPPIAPSSFFDVFFAIPANLTNGTYNLRAWIDAVPDNGVAVNDSVGCVVQACGCGASENSWCSEETAAINDNDTTYYSIFVGTQYHITDVNVCLDITHTWDSDLLIRLLSPMGTEVVLSSHRGGSGDNYTCTTFDDEVSNPIGSGTAPFFAVFNPESLLAALDGEDAYGVWTLLVSDHAGGDFGTVNGACISFEYDRILAAEMTGFTALGANNSVILNWSTSSETNNSRFDIVRNGETVESVNGAGTTSEANTYSWTDTRVTNGTTYSYSLVTVDVNGIREVVGTVNATPNPFGNVAVTDYALAQNFPNPFNPSTEIIYDMKEAGSVSIKVYNVMGQLVATLVNGQVAQGRHTITFDASNLTSGVYVYRMEAGSFVSEHKMLLMK